MATAAHEPCLKIDFASLSQQTPKTNVFHMDGAKKLSALISPSVFEDANFNLVSAARAIFRPEFSPIEPNVFRFEI